MESKKLVNSRFWFSFSSEKKEGSMWLTIHNHARLFFWMRPNRKLVSVTGYSSSIQKHFQKKASYCFLVFYYSMASNGVLIFTRKIKRQKDNSTEQVCLLWRIVFHKNCLPTLKTKSQMLLLNFLIPTSNHQKGTLNLIILHILTFTCFTGFMTWWIFS